MNEHVPNTPNEEIGFERQDLSPKTIYGFLIGLGVACALVALVLWGLYKTMGSYYEKHQQAQNPLVQSGRPSDRLNAPPNEVRSEIQRTIPEPRLEENERTELKDFRLAEEQRLHSYDWIDQNAGTVRIPIDRAMQLIAERGMPTTPRAGTVPPSEVNTVNQAAAKSDTSNLPQRSDGPGKGTKK